MMHQDRTMHQQGFTLIELMIAMVLGLMVTAGVLTVFLSTSASNKAQNQMAAIQETGRFAMSRLKADISMANAQFCNSTGGSAVQANPALADSPYIDNLRAPLVYANGADLLKVLDDVTTPWGASGYPAAPVQPYAIPSFLSMRGYDCDVSSCTPMDPSAFSFTPVVPAMGTAVDDRVVGADVLTLRYLDPNMGWSLGEPSGSTVTESGGTVQINLNPLAGEPLVTEFDGDLAMLADCSGSQVFAVNGQGSNTLTATGNLAQPMASGLRVFDFNRAYRTVTYYLKVVDAGNGHKTGALIRRVSIGPETPTKDMDEQELVRGIERLDFRYGVMMGDGQTHFLTAQEIENNSNAANCPYGQPKPEAAPGNRTGCLWRAVKSIEVSLLADGQKPLARLTDDERSYTYTADNILTPTVPASHVIKPFADQGFSKALLRREFTSLVAIRNYNP